MSEQAPTATPVLSDDRVRLRALAPRDVDAMVELCTDPEMVRFTRVPRPYTRELAERRIAEAATHWATPVAERSWAIELVDGDRFAGLVDLRPGSAPTIASIGYALHPAARGRQAMSAAVRLVARHAFEERPWGAAVTRLHWSAIVGNWSSRRVAWACGFTFHSTLPGSHVDPDDHGAAPLDTWQASLAPDEPMLVRTPWYDPPVIIGAGLRLRPWREEDITAIEPRTADPAHWMPPVAVLRQESFPAWLLSRRERMASGISAEWCIADEASDRAYGSVVIFVRAGTLAGDVAELGYQLFPSARGQGVATAAARLAIGHARAPISAGGLGLRRLVAETAADNTASNRVLEANGFVSFGREHAVDARPDGTYGDGLHWELLPERSPR